MAEGPRVDRIPDEALERPVTGVNLSPGNLRTQLGDGPRLLVFLRHFGCIFCREMVADLRKASDSAADYPPILFFFQGTATEGRAFLRRDWPEVAAISDPPLYFYDALGVGRASFLQAIGPKVLFSARRRALEKGHEFGPRSGDIWRMPGVFIVEGARILWRFEPHHAADHPDFGAIPELALEG